MGIDLARLRKFGELLHQSPTKRVDANRLWTAFAATFPGLAPAERRAHLLQALENLARDGIVELPARRGGRWDRAEVPALPTSVDLVRGAEAPRNDEWRSVIWHARLAWVLDEARVTPAQEHFLRRLNSELVAGGLSATVPFKYRSLQLTRNEKELDALTKSKILFRPGRLSFDDLNCYRETLPFPHYRVGRNPRLIIFENPGPFHVAREVLAHIENPPYGVVAYGGGNGIAQSIAYVATIQPAVTEIAYVGDLDWPGVKIARRAQRAANQLGLPELRPATELHELMLKQRQRFGQPQGWEYDLTPDRDDLDALQFLGPTQRSTVGAMLAAGRRIPEEVLGPEELRHLWA